jgi:hypothetical protein
MSAFQFQYTWKDFGSSDSPEIDATFADLKLVVDEQVVTRVLDKRARTTRDAISVPLYPLAEWLVANWWTLFNEPHTPGRFSSNEAESRHSLYWAQEGFPLPKLSIYSEGNAINLLWAAYRGECHSLEFISSGEARVAMDEFRNAATQLINAVLDRLESLHIASPTLLNNWQAIERADAEESAFCRAAALLGLDPYAISDRTCDTIMEIWEQLPESIRPDMFSAANIERLRDVADWIRDGVAAVGSVEWKNSRFTGMLALPRMDSTSTPWQEGYILARHARKELNIHDNALPDLERFVSPVRVFVPPAPLSSIEGVTALEAQAIRCYTAKTRRESYRFLIARSLVHLLFGAESPITLLTAAMSQRQQRERAFAAEFLIPSDAIRSRVTSDEVTQEEISDLAADFSVSAFVVDYQIKNHHIARIAGT